MIFFSKEHLWSTCFSLTSKCQVISAFLTEVSEGCEAINVFSTLQEAFLTRIILNLTLGNFQLRAFISKKIISKKDKNDVQYPVGPAKSERLFPSPPAFSLLWKVNRPCFQASRLSEVTATGCRQASREMETELRSILPQNLEMWCKEIA